MPKTKRVVKRCLGCGQPERTDAIGYSNIAPALGYCTDCITRAMSQERSK